MEKRGTIGIAISSVGNSLFPLRPIVLCQFYFGADFMVGAERLVAPVSSAPTIHG